MLQTQVQYWANKEQARHNLVTEKQTDTDLARKRDELDETIAQNQRQVDYWTNQLKELTRHNKATEKLTSHELSIKRQQAEASLQQAQAALSNAQTQRDKLPYETAKLSAESNLTGAKFAKTKKEQKWYEAERIGVPIISTAVSLLKGGK